MKLIIISSLLALFSISVIGQNVNPLLDTTLAKSLGADEYGMKMYTFVILKTGENTTKNKTFIDSCFTGHLANIKKLAQEKKLIIAGPFGKNNASFRGIFILNEPNITEANKLLATDPAIQANLLKAELYPWYGSAAISEYLNIHDKIWKKNP